jgi:hypothetical protein
VRARPFCVRVVVLNTPPLPGTPSTAPRCCSRPMNHGSDTTARASRVLNSGPPSGPVRAPADPDARRPRGVAESSVAPPFPIADHQSGAAPAARMECEMKQGSSWEGRGVSRNGLSVSQLVF